MSTLAAYEMGGRKVTIFCQVIRSLAIRLETNELSSS